MLYLPPMSATTSSPWNELARNLAAVPDAARAMRCSARTAAKQLTDALRDMEQAATAGEDRAVSVLTASGSVRQDVSRRRWHQFVEGGPAERGCGGGE